ncbi:DNA-binding protein [Dactylosporangium sp. CA-152071]|uniref:DNA-binding protein n=1 Tax=Dactylosporangium sp. CA-152071 TaxID=3239933 RepID=UPI003D916DBA
MARTVRWTRERLIALGVRTDLVTAGAALGIGRTTAHALARRGEFPVPVLRLGNKYVVPTAPLFALLNVDVEPRKEEPSVA